MLLSSITVFSSFFKDNKNTCLIRVRRIKRMIGSSWSNWLITVQPPTALNLAVGDPMSSSIWHLNVGHTTNHFTQGVLSSIVGQGQSCGDERLLHLVDELHTIEEEGGESARNQIYISRDILPTTTTGDWNRRLGECCKQIKDTNWIGLVWNSQNWHCRKQCWRDRFNETTVLTVVGKLEFSQHWWRALLEPETFHHSICCWPYIIIGGNPVISTASELVPHLLKHLKAKWECRWKSLENLLHNFCWEIICSIQILT